MSNQVQQRAANPVAHMSHFLDRMKAQMALALPKHLTPDRMARLALTQFSTNPSLQRCTQESFAASVMMSATVGLEIGVNGQAFLVPYGSTCTFVPGWKGLVDIANRSGRCSVWTGAVFEGDDFDYALGDSPYVRHRPGEEDDPAKLTHVYAIGRVNGSNWPVIEVWTMGKVWKHRDQYNKVGRKHYSFRDPEMYARKVPLLQVLKYMPSSVELSNALTASTAAETGKGLVIDGSVVTIDESRSEQEQSLPECAQDSFDARKVEWRQIVESGRQSPNDLINMIETKELLSAEQKMEIASWAQQG